MAFGVDGPFDVDGASVCIGFGLDGPSDVDGVAKFVSKSVIKYII